MFTSKQQTRQTNPLELFSLSFTSTIYKNLRLPNLPRRNYPTDYFLRVPLSILGLMQN